MRTCLLCSCEGTMRIEPAALGVEGVVHHALCGRDLAAFDAALEGKEGVSRRLRAGGAPVPGAGPGPWASKPTLRSPTSATATAGAPFRTRRGHGRCLPTPPCRCRPLPASTWRAPAAASSWAGGTRPRSRTAERLAASLDVTLVLEAPPGDALPPRVRRLNVLSGRVERLTGSLGRFRPRPGRTRRAPPLGAIDPGLRAARRADERH